MSRPARARLSWFAPALLVCLATPGCGEKPRLPFSGGGGPSTPPNLIGAIGDSAIEGISPLVLEIRRHHPGPGNASAEFETVESTATSGEDYHPVRGKLEWGPGDGSSRFVSIEIVHDKKYELPEYFKFRLFNLAGGELYSKAPLTITIHDSSELPTLTADVRRISSKEGGVQTLTLRAGLPHANRDYILAGSLSPVPGFTMDGVHVRLTPDAWFELTLTLANTSMFPGFRGQFDSFGVATAKIVVPPDAYNSAVGLNLVHAYIVFDEGGVARMASQYETLEIEP
jgi:Calx-beta domain